ncbi:hypothetical protein G5V59_25590 [Nocardioides sp. W3-2-3]|nr:hypothetical protein [Nocardioides convexus]
MLLRRRGTRQDERGAVTLVMVFVLVVMLLGSAFVVDLGVQRVARSDMQAIADLVALDLARELDGRTVTDVRPAVDAEPAPQQRAQRRRDRHRDAAGRPTGSARCATASSWSWPPACPPRSGSPPAPRSPTASPP